jgi:hypothetical protein
MYQSHSSIHLPYWLPNMSFTLQVILMGVLGTYVVLWAVLRLTQDAKEPRAIDTLVPFISPGINMIMKGSTYFKSRR